MRSNYLFNNNHCFEMKTHKVSIFHIVPICVVKVCYNSDMMTPLEIEISGNFSTKHSVQGNCKNLSIIYSLWRKKSFLFLGSSHVSSCWREGSSQTGLCFSISFYGENVLRFGIKLYLYPCSMFYVLWLYRDVLKTLNVILRSSFHSTMCCDSWHFK